MKPALNLSFSPNGNDFYVAALGVCTAMRRGALPLEAGIWTLARPEFADAASAACADEGLRGILGVLGELDALHALGGDAAAESDGICAALSALLSKHYADNGDLGIRATFQAA